MAPTALILRSAGTNCDRELTHAFEQAGALTKLVHLNQLIAEPELLRQVQIVGFPGGFSYGDDIAAGRIFANRLRQRLWEPLLQAVDRGTLMIGICNGFQVLIKLGLLPDPHAATPQATLTDNVSGRFTDRWVSLRAHRDSVCVWTQGLDQFDLPIAHGEGQLATASPAVLEQLRVRRQIALTYDTTSGNFPGNPNGSAADVAGLCDPTGVVLGLMPHPERFVHATHHPHWTRRAIAQDAQPAWGLHFFQNAVRVFKDRPRPRTLGSLSAV